VSLIDTADFISTESRDCDQCNSVKYDDGHCGISGCNKELLFHND